MEVSSAGLNALERERHRGRDRERDSESESESGREEERQRRDREGRESPTKSVSFKTTIIHPTRKCSEFVGTLQEPTAGAGLSTTYVSFSKLPGTSSEPEQFRTPRAGPTPPSRKCSSLGT